MKLAAYLESTGTKASVFATQVGCPPSTITRILRGERSPGVDLIARIRAASGGSVSFEDFLADDREPSEAELRSSPDEAAA